MSYCRWGWEGSELYIFGNTEGQIECHCCPLMEGAALSPALMTDNAALLEHLTAHDAAGHRYPTRLRAELEAHVKS